ncbi:MAG TPA: transglutaminase family protein [Opitutaceae bacterium]|nr:transglutaminase family protein [Opitutaceae bacterium]
MTHAPYSDSAWEKIHACAARVEEVLVQSDLYVTMGGEPTFVPLKPEGAEWQTAALGPTKLGYARAFARQLIQDSLPGAVILETIGKHYPGEPLPRWTLLVQRRKKGAPVWRDITRLKGDLLPGKHTVADAHEVIRKIAGLLGVGVETILPCAEVNQPDATVGYVLPLDRNESLWISDNWSPVFKANTVSLIPGDSLLGLRLPLGQLKEDNVRRALTVEIKEGTLTLFIPPLLSEHYLSLLAVVESVVESLRLKDLVLGGYAPPMEPDLPTVGFASDPGVIEINLAVCATWADYDHHLNEVFAAAAKVGLCAHKFALNGRTTGTGGGAHLVFGGPIGWVSPFFSRPSFLPSIIRYFQHHPALSYAFTGQYLGPSSQAPRIDESTFEALYELEIACEGAERLGSPQNYALFDLLFRDLLMDRSGNTHRAEISVDKLWNPFAGNGRLGLVELRAFETNPLRATQSITALLVRAIFARLAADPFKSPFIRWNGELHDRFFLPSFVWQDLARIVADLHAHGIPFELEWLRPLFEFRFPKLGQFALAIPERKENGKTLPAETFSIEFRQALEAWPLLGESPNAGTVSRTVDASMDRIEASVSDLKTLEKGLLLINGYPCEFRPVETVSGHAKSGEAAAAAGIRFRAFYLTPALQPHIPVHSPLLIEWVDLRTLTVVAAARWHVWNPRSAPYVDRPADEATAITRQKERWEEWPYSLGQARYIPKIDFPPEGRYTLDLRRYASQARA